MPLTIHHPLSPPSDSDSDSDSDISMDEASNDLPFSTSQLVTPGQLLTTSTSYMRGHGTSSGPPPPSAPQSLDSLVADSGDSSIHSTILGTPTLTNRLLTITPLGSSPQYVSQIGDTVIGRVVSVQPKRWTLSIGGPSLASLPLSAITLPGGVQRRRTGADELQIRRFLSEGDLVVCEVQTLPRGDGGGNVGVHTRSGRGGFGKCRNGVLVDVRGERVGCIAAASAKRRERASAPGAGNGRTTGEAGAASLRVGRQVFDVPVSISGEGRGLVDVIVGVNGLIWVCQHPSSDETDDTSLSSPTSAARTPNRTAKSFSALESGSAEEGSLMYAHQNDAISSGMRREICRVCRVVRSLLGEARRVDAESVRGAYREDVEEELVREGR